MPLTIQQIEALARSNLRGDYFANFNDRAQNLYNKRDRALHVGCTHAEFRAWMAHPERYAKERQIRAECRVALAALFARLYQEQQKKGTIP
jgi:hypothetical protein